MKQLFFLSTCALILLSSCKKDECSVPNQNVNLTFVKESSTKSSFLAAGVGENPGSAAFIAVFKGISPEKLSGIKMVFKPEGGLTGCQPIKKVVLNSTTNLTMSGDTLIIPIAANPNQNFQFSLAVSVYGIGFNGVLSTMTITPIIVSAELKHGNQKGWVKLQNPVSGAPMKIVGSCPVIQIDSTANIGEGSLPLFDMFVKSTDMGPTALGGVQISTTATGTVLSNYWPFTNNVPQSHTVTQSGDTYEVLLNSPLMVSVGSTQKFTLWADVNPWAPASMFTTVKNIGFYDRLSNTPDQLIWVKGWMDHFRTDETQIKVHQTIQ